MKAKNVINSRCADCGATKNLVRHHTSYVPERTKILCRSCNAKERRYPPNRGLLPILKAYPPRGTIYVPRDILKQFGGLIEFYLAPISPVGILFPYKMPFNEVERSLEIVLQDIRLRIDKKEE